MFRSTSYIIEPVWKSLIAAYDYGTAAPMQSLIDTLKILYSRIEMGNIVDLYYPAESPKQIINKDTFDRIIKLYFDEFVVEKAKR